MLRDDLLSLLFAACAEAAELPAESVALTT